MDLGKSDAPIDDKFLTELTSFDGFVLPTVYKELKKQIENLEVSERDVWICSFPRSGSTWTQEMVWMIVNNCDFEGAQIPIYERCLFLEKKGFRVYDSSGANPIEQINNRKDVQKPLVIKTHFTFKSLPKDISSELKKPKIIYVTRNVKDTCVSCYHYCKFIFDYRGDFSEFCELFLAGKVPYSPYWNHVMSYWQMRHNPNILFLRYEEMKSDLGGVIRRVSQFLEKPMTDEQIEVLIHHLTFETMTKNPAVNYTALHEPLRKVRPEGRFIRKGRIGDHKTIMSLDMQKKFDEWIESSLQDTDYSM
ncbi:luciferin sulfotransferase-like [Tenebrio molitor]|uniref:luciferin sulfotransferase-like n=1 Tax=Tenebrio molitor TaxID=7067 RepID=UPI003624775C